MIQSKNALRLAVLAAMTAGSMGANAALVTTAGAAFTPAQVASELPITGILLTANASQLRAGHAITTFTPSAGQNLMVRVALDNGAKFATAPTLTCSAAAAAQGTLNLGGAGADSAVFTVGSGALGAVDSALTHCYVSAADMTITGAHNAVNMSVTYTYGTLASATNLDPLVQFQTGLTATKTAGTDVVALVATGFISLSGASAATILNAGTVAWGGDGSAASTATNLATMMTLADAMGATSGSVTVASDALAAAKVTAGVWLISAGGSCVTTAAAGAIATAAGGASPVTFTGLTPAQLTAGLNVCIEFNGTTAIPAATITATPSGVALAGYSLPTAAAQTLMTISRNGTTLVAPLVNQPAGWISRLVLVNRGSTAAGYTVSAQGETGNTVALTGAGATGTIAATSTTVIDLTTTMTATVTPRASLMATIAGTQGNVDGMYQIVSPSGSISNYTLISK